MLLTLAPYFGYLASLFLIIALLVNTDLKFRWYNTMGNVAFIIYAIVLHAFPVLLTNVILLTINVYYLVKVYRRKENFDLLEFKGDEALLQKFLQFYREDINHYFPDFDAAQLNGRLNFMVIRDLVIANIFSATLTAEGDAEVNLNYTVKKYRDYKVGSFIFEKERDFLVHKGIKRIVYKNVSNKKHEEFLRVMGFVREADGYVKNI
ncbi:MAG: hypothetical protein JWQ27_924 [Ferruginibacter sp.]|nr:hypothetical protein [Ferruginibacter sp.]